MLSEQMTQAMAIADVLNYQSVNNTNVNSAGIDLSKFRRVLFVVRCHSIGAAGTIDGRLQSAAASNFATPHNVTNSNITQITANDRIATIEVRADQVQQQNAGDRYLRLQLTGGGNAVTLSAIGLAGEAIQKHATGSDLAAASGGVSERVVVNT